MFAFKACPRCRRGDLYLDRFGEVACVQCGHELSPAMRARFLAVVARPGRRPAVAPKAA